MSLPIPRTDIIQRYLNRLSINASVKAAHIAAPGQIASALDESLNEISLRRPVSGATGKCSVGVNTQQVLLPDNWLINNLPNKEILRAIYLGRDPRGPRQTNAPLQTGFFGNSTYGYGYGYNYSYGFGSRFQPSSRSLQPALSAPNPPDRIPEAHTEIIDNVQRTVFTLVFPSNVTKSWDVVYNAKYEIVDGIAATMTDPEIPAINTFPEQYDSFLFRVMDVIVATMRVFDLDISVKYGGKRDPIDAIEKKERMIAQILSGITPRARCR